MARKANQWLLIHDISWDIFGNGVSRQHSDFECRRILNRCVRAFCLHFRVASYSSLMIKFAVYTSRWQFAGYCAEYRVSVRYHIDLLDVDNVSLRHIVSAYGSTGCYSFSGPSFCLSICSWLHRFLVQYVFAESDGGASSLECAQLC